MRARRHFQKSREPGALVQRVDILTLQILDQLQLGSLGLVYIPHDGVNGVPALILGVEIPQNSKCPAAPFAGDDLVPAIGLAHRDRLQQPAVGLDAESQLV